MCGCHKAESGETRTHTHQAISEGMRGVAKVEQGVVEIRVGVVKLRMGVFHFDGGNQGQLAHHTRVRQQHGGAPLV